MDKFKVEIPLDKVDWSMFYEGCDFADESFIKFISDTDVADRTLENYKQSLASASSSTAKFGATLKSIGANIGIMLAITLAVKAASAAWDYFNVTVEETQEKIDGINSRISELKSEIEQLDSVQFKTTQQEVRLSNLERELDLQEKLLEIEQRRYYQELTGNKFTDAFDNNNLNTIYEQERIGYDNAINPNKYGQVKQDYADTKKLLEEVSAEIEKNKGNEKELAKLTENRNKLLEQQANNASFLAEKETEYYNYYQQAQEAIDSRLLHGTELKEAEELTEKWRLAYEEAKKYSTSAQKSAGMYTYENEIEGILSKVDFDGVKEKLVSLGEDGSLSVDVLKNRFSGLIEYLKQVGIDAQTLLGYIMQMSNPDAINFEDAKNKLLQATGVSDMAGNLADEAYNKLQEAGMFTDEALGVFLRLIVDKDTSKWSIDDFIHNIQNGLNAEPLELVVETLGVTETIEQLKIQLQPTIDSLADAYNNIFTTDGFTRENIGLDMFSSIKDELDNLQKSLEESGSSAIVDYSAYEKLVSVLNDADSSAQQIKDAFDEVALSVANVSITGLEDFQVLKESLEQLGYVDADLVAFETLVSNMEALKAAGLDLADTSLTESDFISFVDSLGISAEYATQAVNMLTFAQELNKAESLDTSGSVAELLSLAQNAGYTGEIIQWLTRLMEIYKQLESGFLDPHTIQDYVFEAQQITTKIQESAGKINIAPNERTIDWKPLQKAAGKAGKDAGKTYKEKLEEELSSLGDVINYIGDIISEQVDLWEDAKDAAVDALEAEKQAAEDALQAQIDLVEAQIEAIEDQIEAKEKEIEKIQDARKERDLELASQKALYEWNRQMSQKTRLIYKEGNDGVPGQMVYETDSKGIRDAKEEYDRTQEDLEINRIEKEIKILEEEIEGLEDIIDGLNDQIDLSNNYYDNLIKQTEAYYDSMIKGLEDYKNRWDELAEIEEQAKMNVKLQELGIETADILNMSEEAFNSFKNQYLSILTEMYNGETDMVNAINSVAQGLDTTALETGLTKTKENIDKLNTADFTSVKTGLDNVSSSINSVGSSAITTSSNVDSMTDSLNEANLAKKELLNVASELEGMTSLKQIIDTVVDSVNQKTDAFEKERQKVSEVVQSEITELESLDANINTVTNSISLMNESSVGINSLAESCTSLGEAIANIAKSLGVEGGSVSGLVTALQDLSTISLMGEDGQSGILSQFYMLKTAIDSVTSAVNGCGAMNVDGGGASSGSTGAASQTGSGQGGFGGLTGAIREIGTVTDETIGGSGENSESSEKGEGSASDSEGDGVLGKFGAFKESVDAVTQAIGTGEEEEGSEEGASTLIGALQLHYEKAQETLPEVKNMFQELLDKILECIAALSELAGAMSSLSGSGVGFAEGTVGSAFVNGTVGKAFAKGTSRFKGLTKDEPFTIRSEYGQPELTVHPNGIVEYTDTPTVAPLKKDTVIFNEQQTKKILNNNHGKFIGNAYESGTESKLPILNREEMSQLDFIVEATRRFKELKLTAPEELMRPIGGIYENTEKMLESINSINTNKYNTGISVGEVHVHCSGITSKEVAEEAALQTFNELQKATFGLSNAARQHNTTVNKYY